MRRRGLLEVGQPFAAPRLGVFKRFFPRVTLSEHLVFKSSLADADGKGLNPGRIFVPVNDDGLATPALLGFPQSFFVCHSNAAEQRCYCEH
jgi:hypothetical protein